MNPYLSLIIPVYNDAKIIGASLEKIESSLKEWGPKGYEILVVNDGSHDGTERVVKDYLRRHPASPIRLLPFAKNRGKGFAVAQGMLASTGRFRFFSDSDLSTPLTYLKPCIDALEGGADVVAACRFSAGSKILVDRSPWIRFLSLCERFFIEVLSGLRLSDTQCGFKGFRSEAAQRIFSRQRIERFCFDVESLFLAEKWGHRIEIVPVRWSHNRDSRVRTCDLFLFVRDLLRLRWFWRKGVYE